MEYIAPSKGAWERVRTAASTAGGRQPVPALGEQDTSHHCTSSGDAQQGRTRGNYKPSLAQTRT